MKRNLLKISLLIVVALSFTFSYAAAQELKIVGKPITAAFPFADIIAKNMQLAGPDSANSRLTSKELHLELAAPDDKDKWVVMDYELNRTNDTIRSVMLIGDVNRIVDLYILLYDKNAKKKFKNGDLRTSVVKDGEITTIITDHKAMYKRVTKFWGAIKVEKYSR